MKKQKIKKPIWIFLHVPKTGGGTFNQHLEKTLPEEEFSRIDDLEKRKKETNKLKVIAGHDTYYGVHKYFPDREARYLVFLRDPAEKFVSAYNFDMRNIPEKEVISFKKWYKSRIDNEMCRYLFRKFQGKKGIQVSIPVYKTLKFFKITDSAKKLSLLRAIYRSISKVKRNKKQQEKEFQKAKEVLDLCWFVSVTENLNTDLKFLFKKIGAPVKAEQKHKTGSSDIKKRYSLDEKTRKKIYKDNKFDLELYRYAKKLREEKLKSPHNPTL